MYITGLPKITEEKINENRSKFIFEPLEPGFGYTLGNSLRRTLLSSIPGAAITAFRSEGVLHEFDVLEGVKEDIPHLILNIKKIAVSSDSDEPLVAYIRKSSEGPVYASDITVPAGVEIHNKDLVIAHLSKNGSIDMEFTIERGRGYVPSSINRNRYNSVGHIALDAIYSPVIKVSYNVEAARSGYRTDFDKLIIDVETNGALSPKDAVASAGSTLVELFGLFKKLNESSEGLELYEAPAIGDADFEPSYQIETSIKDLDLSARTLNCLMRENITTLQTLVSLNESDLLKIRNMGQKAVDEVKEKLEELNMGLKED